METENVVVFHTNLNRVFTDLDRALEIAQSYTIQTDWIHRVEVVRGMYMVRKTDERVPILPDIEVCVKMNQNWQEGIITASEYQAFYDSTFGAQSAAWAKARELL